MDQGVPTKQPCPLDERERFLKLYDVIVDAFDRYIKNVTWTAGLLAVAIGWFLSSTNTRDFVRDSHKAYLGALGVVGVVVLLHTSASWVYYRHSSRRVAEMRARYSSLEPLPFDDYRITASVFLINLLLNWALAAGLLLFIEAAQHKARGLLSCGWCGLTMG